jgi:predicted nucleic acid-binding protein
LAIPQTFIDTLFVVALISQRDRYHEQATEMADLYEGQPLLTTEGVLLEIGNALARGYKAEAVEVIQGFLSSPDVQVVRLTPELFDRAFALYQSHQDKEWGLIDCISFIVMGDAGAAEALTFDKHFVQAGFRALLREQESGS